VTLPAGIRVHALLSERVPRVRWDPAAVVQCVADFDDLDVVEVAAHCALYMQQHTAANNGPRTLRTFMERAREHQALEQLKTDRAKALAPYHRPRNST
jgi:hypothetical protein